MEPLIGGLNGTSGRCRCEDAQFDEMKRRSNLPSRPHVERNLL